MIWALTKKMTKKNKEWSTVMGIKFNILRKKYLKIILMVIVCICSFEKTIFAHSITGYVAPYTYNTGPTQAKGLCH